MGRVTAVTQPAGEGVATVSLVGIQPNEKNSRLKKRMKHGSKQIPTKFLTRQKLGWSLTATCIGLHMDKNSFSTVSLGDRNIANLVSLLSGQILRGLTNEALSPIRFSLTPELTIFASDQRALLGRFRLAGLLSRPNHDKLKLTVFQSLAKEVQPYGTGWYQ
ncbi:MAG: hypothetical protein ACK40X_07505 [Armatimonadota bacterium]